MQNRISLLFALGTCCASATVAAPLTAADLVAVLIAGLSVDEPLHSGSLSIFPAHGARPPARARDPGRDPQRGDRARLAHLPGVARGLRRAAAVVLQSWADAAILITAGEELPGCGDLVAVRDVLVSPGARGLVVARECPRPRSREPATSDRGSAGCMRWRRSRRGSRPGARACWSLSATGWSGSSCSRAPGCSLGHGRTCCGRRHSRPSPALTVRRWTAKRPSGFLRDLAGLPWSAARTAGARVRGRGIGPGEYRPAPSSSAVRSCISPRLARGEPLLLAPPEPARP